MDLFDDDDGRFSIVLRKTDRKIYCNLICWKIHDGKLDALKLKQRANSAKQEAACVYVCLQKKSSMPQTVLSLCVCRIEACVHLKSEN